MDAICGGSSLTIAAAWSPNSHGGLFPSAKEPWVYHFRLNHRGHLPIHVHVRKTFCQIVHQDFFVGGQRASPLLGRGWVFQERVLTPRTLFFAREEAVWECRQSTRCQCTADGIVRREHNLPQHVDVAQTGYVDLKSIVGTRFTNPAELWESIVEAYARLDITVPSDKLVALSGIAKHLQAQKPAIYGDYLAGLWSPWLNHGPFRLLWHVPGRCTPRSPAPSWRAPSWSWASIDAPIAFIDEISASYLAPTCSILNAECVPRPGHDAFGQLAAGTLRVRGYVVPLSLFRH